MLLLVGAIVVGVLVGLLFGGSLRNLGHAHFRWWGLAFLAAALQFLPAPSGADHRWIGAAFLIASYAALIAFIALNIRLPGLWLVAVGFALNLVVIAANGGMPVRDHALRVAYPNGYLAQRRELVQGGESKHHLERPDDKLMPLDDEIPVDGPVQQVLSVGDVVWLVGTVWLVAGLTRRPEDEVTEPQRESVPTSTEPV